MIEPLEGETLPTNQGVIMAAKKNQHRPVRNEDCYRAMLGFRSSNAATPQVPKPRKGTRSAQKQKAIRDWN